MRRFFIDTETTGLGTRTTAWQVACVVTDENGNEVAVFNEKIRTAPWSFQKEARAMCPLSFWQLLKLPSRKEVGERLEKFIEEHLEENYFDNVLWGHNTKFDTEVLQNTFGKKILSKLCFKYHDTLSLLCMLQDFGAYTGKKIALDKLGLHEGKAHDALADVRATIKLHGIISGKLKGVSFDTVD